MRAIAFAAVVATLGASGARACEASKGGFDDLRPGLSGAEVEKIVGCAGQTVAETGDDGRKTVILQWPGNGGPDSNLTVTLENDRLVEKAQSRLKQAEGAGGQ